MAANTEFDRDQRPEGWWVWPAQVWRRVVPPVRVQRRIGGMKLHLCLRDNIRQLLSVANLMREVESLLQEDFCRFWDLGCNVGVYSLMAAKLGREVAAFDISPKAIEMLDASAAANGLTIATAARAVTVERLRYGRVEGAHTENRLIAAAGMESTESMSFREASERYGVPDLIKMDIEGGELEFLKSEEFRRWVVENKITLAIELHSKAAEHHVWKGLRTRWIDSKHVILNTTVGGSDD